ncbi:MAG: glycosyltransferase family 4 protein [Candidatus Helarchaeota archaeon]
MKISHVIQRYYPAISGSELYFQRISEILSKRHSIKIFCSNALDFNSFGNPNGKTISTNYSYLNNIPIYRFPIKYNYFINKFPLIEYRNIKKLLKKLAKFRIPIIDIYDILTNGPNCPSLLKYLLNHDMDIVHSTCMPFSTNLFALIAGKRKEIPTLITPFFHIANPRYQTSSILRILQKFDKILTCSKIESEYIIKYSGNNNIRKKINIIKMGVDLRKFRKATPDRFREKYNIEDNPMVLFCGYKNYEKGAIHLLRSLKYVIKKIPNVIYVFIGPSTKAFNIEKKLLKSELRRHIINFGVVPYDNLKIKINSFVATDIYAMPSRSDAYGIAFLEAFACKKPVIGANIGATPEIIQNNVNGLLIPFGSPKELGNAIIKLLTDQNLKNKLGYNGYEKIKNQTWENISKKIEEIYLSLKK